MKAAVSARPAVKAQAGCGVLWNACVRAKLKSAKSTRYSKSPSRSRAIPSARSVMLRRGRFRVSFDISAPQSNDAFRKPRDRKSDVSGKRGSVRVDLGGRRVIKKKTTNQ